MLLLQTICLLLLPVIITAQHPLTFFTRTDALQVLKNVTKFPLLNRSFIELNNGVDGRVNKDVHEPFPNGRAGIYTLKKHKANYMLMFTARSFTTLIYDNKI